MLVVALASCRSGFEPVGGQPGDGDAGGNTTGAITVIVTGDESATAPAGRPIGHATVLIDRGQVERTETNDAGSVQFPLAGVVAYHVVYQIDQRWRIYTVAAPKAGTIELGGRPASSVSRQMTLSVPREPRGSTITLYSATIPDHCSILGLQSSPTWQFYFPPSCEGRMPHMIVFGLDSGGRATAYIDAGNVTLANGTTLTVTGSYTPIATQTIQIANLPPGTVRVAAAIAERTGVELTRLGPAFASAAVQSGSATVTPTAAPGGNAIFIEASTLDLPYSSRSQRVAPLATSTTTFDAGPMLPLFTSLTVDRLPVLSWLGGGTGELLVAVEASTSAVQWTAYVAPSATSATFPAALADLGVPMPRLFDSVRVTKLDVPGATAADIELGHADAVE